MKLKDLHVNDYFTKKEIPFPTENQVWFKISYDRSSKKYLCARFSDINDSCLISGSKDVFTDFTF